MRGNPLRLRTREATAGSTRRSSFSNFAGAGKFVGGSDRHDECTDIYRGGPAVAVERRTYRDAHRSKGPTGMNFVVVRHVNPCDRTGRRRRRAALTETGDAATLAADG